jgi:hypothetical protein
LGTCSLENEDRLRLCKYSQSVVCLAQLAATLRNEGARGGATGDPRDRRTTKRNTAAPKEERGRPFPSHVVHAAVHQEIRALRGSTLEKDADEERLRKLKDF